MQYMTIPRIHIPNEYIKKLYIKYCIVHISLRQQPADHDPVLEMHA